jgi:nucleoside-triphosphatase
MDNKIFIISGSQGSGKTTLLKRTIKFLKEKNFQVGGIVAEGYWKNDQRDRFDLVNQTTGEKIVFCQRDEIEEWEKIRHFYINPKGQEFGESILHPNTIKHSDVCVIDEIGPFEIANKGWFNAINKLLINSNIPMIWVVRNSLIDEILAKWNISPTLIIDSKEVHQNVLIENIYNLLSKKPI